MRNGGNINTSILFYYACLLQREIDAEIIALKEFEHSGYYFKYYLN